MTQQSDAQARVLFVDNREGTLTSWNRILQKRGYTPFLYHVQDANWMQDCLAVARKARPHVVVLDLRLEDDYRLSDESGLKLLSEIKIKSPATQCVVYSAYLDTDFARKIGDSGAEFFKKGRDPLELLAIIDRLARKASSATRLNRIGWPYAWNQQSIVNRLLETTTNQSVEPLNICEDLVHQLFPDAHHLTVEHLDGKFGVGPEPISIGRSVVGYVQRDNFPVKKILKIATSERVAQEKENYDKHIRDQVTGVYHTQLENSTLFWDLGASIYSFLADDGQRLQSFLSFFQNPENNVEQIWKPINEFFSKTWKFHYSNVTPSKILLYDVYDQCFCLDKKLARFDIQTLALDKQYTQMGDPVRWIQQNKNALGYHSVRQAVTHGDFHGDNLFTNGEKLWVIDFERTGLGHVLRDFCELAIDLIIRGIDEHSLPLNDFIRVAAQIVGFRLEQNETVHNADAQKLIALTQRLQELAGEVTGSRDLREYQLALLFDASFTFLRDGDPSRRFERQRAWILSVLLCEYLSSPNIQNLPPSILSVLYPAPSVRDSSAKYSTRGDMQIHKTDLDRLRDLLHRHPAWRDKSAPARRSFLRTAGVPEQYVDDYPLDGTAADSRIVIDDLRNRRGHLRNDPNYTALGRLLASMLTDEAELEGDWFISQCIVRYRLVDDADFLNDLHQQYGSWIQQTDLGWSSAGPEFRLNTDSAGGGLEKEWTRARFNDSVAFFERGLAVAKATGRIERVNGSPVGTGFLVAPDLLLTNHHVIPAETDLSQLRVRFGYRIDRFGLLQQGAVYAFEKVIAFSPTKELDYSLVRVVGAPGKSEEIGFVRPVDKMIQVKQPLYIIQHPSGDPQKVVLQDNWTVYVSADHRRVQYLTNTRSGSSGSPVCDEDWNVVALHHSGEPYPAFASNSRVQGNEGIPMYAILPEIQQFL